MDREYILKWCLVIILSLAGAYVSMSLGGGLPVYENQKEWEAYEKAIQKKESLTDAEFAEFLGQSNAFAADRDMAVLAAKRVSPGKRAAIVTGVIIWLLLGAYCGFSGFSNFLFAAFVLAISASPFIGFGEIIIYFLSFGIGNTLSPWARNRFGGAP